MAIYNHNLQSILLLLFLFTIIFYLRFLTFDFRLLLTHELAAAGKSKIVNLQSKILFTIFDF
jgi:hypothetical protein